MSRKKNTVAVMMATYNGSKFIKEQIESILNQEAVCVKLYVRDDGSTDNTFEILKCYEQKGDLVLFTGENYGPARNFYELLKKCNDEDYYAWSDQDDIWDNDKLKVAVDVLNGIKNPIRLYWCQNRKMEDGILYDDGEKIKPSVTFASSLMGSNAQGATMVFSQELKNLAIKFTPDFKKLNLFHDAWLHKLCLAVGGKVFYDYRAHITYRIHENNVVAVRKTEGSSNLMERIKKQFAMNSENYYSNIARLLLDNYGDLMPNMNKRYAVIVSEYMHNLRYKIELIFLPDFKRSGVKKNVVFVVNCFFNRL